MRPEVLLDVADRLEGLAREYPPRRADLQRCLSDLERAWQGGTAGPLAVARLRRLIDLSAPSPAAMDALPVAERDRLNRTYFAGHPAFERLAGYVHRGDAWILGFDPRGDGRIIVAFGDPSASSHVATFVPGAGATLRDVEGELERALTLKERAGDTASVVMWLGYDPPDLADAALGRAARSAAVPLLAFQAGLAADHRGESVHRTVIGHSYGSVVVGAAASRGELFADELIVVGSPGLGVGNRSAQGLGAAVWASTAADDPIRLVPPPVHGPDPVAPGFGARLFASAPLGHSGYFDRRNPALDSMAAIITGRIH